MYLRLGEGKVGVVRREGRSVCNRRGGGGRMTSLAVTEVDVSLYIMQKQEEAERHEIEKGRKNE